MKFIKNNAKYIGIVMICVFCSYLTAIATNYAFDSGDVRFDNTGTSLESVNVQDAIDETFHHVTDYNEIKTTIGNSTLTTTNQTLTGGINELNSKVVNSSDYVLSTFDDVKSKLLELAGNMGAGESKLVRIVYTGTEVPPMLKNYRYMGYLKKSYSGNFFTWDASAYSGDDIHFAYDNSTWRVYSLNSKLITKNISNPINLASGATSVSSNAYKTGNVVQLVFQATFASLSNGTNILSSMVDSIKPKLRTIVSVFDFNTGKPLNGTLWISNASIYYYGDSLTNKTIIIVATYLTE